MGLKLLGRRMNSAPTSYWATLCLAAGLILGCGDNQPTPLPISPDSGPVSDMTMSGPDATSDIDGTVQPDPDMRVAPSDAEVPVDFADPPDEDVSECAVNNDCPGAQTCSDGVCFEAARCDEDVDCFTGRVCVNRECADACESDDDCPGTRTCVPESGRCIQGESCNIDGDCDDGGFGAEYGICMLGDDCTDCG